MNDVTTTPDLADDVLPDEITSRLSIFEKTTPELRRKLDKAILDYEPAGYRPLFKKYNLADVGVSFTAFYRYARKLRARAATLQLAADVLQTADGPSLVEILPDLISQHLVEQIMANEQTGPDAIYKLTLAHRAALENAAMARKHNAARVAAAVSEAGESREKTNLRGCPTAPPAKSLSDLSTDELLARATTTLSAGNAQLAAELEEAKKSFGAMGYPVANVKTVDELCGIVDHFDPTAAVAPASRSEPVVQATGASTPSRACPPDACAADTTLASSRSEISNPDISNPQISNSEISNPPTAPPPPKLPLINQDFPDPDPEREKLRCQVRAAYKLSLDPPSDSNLLESLIDPALPKADPSTPDEDLSPAQLRQKELRRVLLDHGLIKDSAPDSS